MIYKRQKILLALIEQFGGRLHNTDLQKYLFLLSRLQKEQSYFFVPYKYGCFSFQACQDKRTLIQKGYLENCEDWVLTASSQFRLSLSHEDSDCIWRVKKEFGHLSGKSLIQYVYKAHPYYAIKSVIASELLTGSEFAEVEKQRLPQKDFLLCSIGYEGKTIEEYLNALIQKDIKVLCDVRKNPISRKYGFSRRTLENAVNRLGIEYKHYPKLGIEANKRAVLERQSDYDRLFEEYEKTVLVKQYEDILAIRGVLKTRKRIALTCYEKSPQQCHRTRVAKSVMEECEVPVPFNEI